MKPFFYRRAPSVVCYWEEGTLVLENYAAHTRAGVDPVAALVLHELDGWSPEAAILQRFRQYDAVSVRESLRLLVRHKFLERSRERPRESKPAVGWPEWTPSAAHFHFHTKDSPYTNDAAAERAFYRKRARQWPIPAALKRYAKRPELSLPAPQATGQFARVLLKRRTWRRFAPAPVSLQQVATLLQFTWGVQSWMRFPILGRLARKTSPSGGARHPIEAYLVALRVQGLKRGVYHYAAAKHQLSVIRRGATARQAEEWLAGQRWFGNAAAVVLMTAVFARTQWKYPLPRAYRVVLADAGHLAQTFCLAATWQGLAPFCTMALAESKIERALGIDGVKESALYAVGVGQRPHDQRDPGALPD